MYNCHFSFRRNFSALLLALLSLLAAHAARAQTVRTSVLPSVTDPKIDTFDVAHTIYRNPTAKSRHELLVFLPGTNGGTRGTTKFCTTAADLGYHVVSLMYPDDLSASVCRNDANQESFAKFRLAIIEGGVSPYVTVNRANSIENRLIKLLAYLKEKQPKDEWGQFLQTDKTTKADTPVWEKIALSGQSQGGGHAALIACRHKVARVLMFSSPKDWSRYANKPAAWYKPSKTLASRIFAFVHEQDKQACSWTEQLEILKTMGLGEPQSVDKTGPPFNKAHALTTNFPGTPVTSMEAHATEVTDARTPNDASGNPKFKPVWEYMLTAP